MTHRRPPRSTEPGTPTERYVEACVHPCDHPRLSESIETEDDELAATQWTGFGRTWQCDGDYWDVELADVVTLLTVQRRSGLLSTRDAQECPIEFVFEAEHGGAHGIDRSNVHVYRYQPASAVADTDRLDPTERFLSRHNVPFKLR